MRHFSDQLDAVEQASVRTGRKHDDSSGPDSSDPVCRNGWCSIGLMRSLCPTCLLLGVALLAFEFIGRGFRRLLGAA